VRAQMYSQSPPEVEGFMDDDPELVEQAWQALLDLLYDHGYQPK